jgi:hypothetical protein
MAGHVTPAGVFVEVGAARLPLPATAQTVREWVAEIASMPPCIHCGAACWGCDCADWLEWMAAADHDRRLREEADNVA